MNGAPTTRRACLSHPASSPGRAAFVQCVTLAVACLFAFELVTQILRRVYSLSSGDDLLGGLWAGVATIFVFRVSYEESVTAAISRMAATLVSFVLCLTFLLLLPFTAWGMTLLIGVGSLVVTLMGRPGDTVTTGMTGMTTTVVMVVAALEPHNAWQQPILRLVDTAAGVAVGLAAARLGLRDASAPSGASITEVSQHIWVGRRRNHWRDRCNPSARSSPCGDAVGLLTATRARTTGCKNSPSVLHASAISRSYALSKSTNGT